MSSFYRKYGLYFITLLCLMLGSFFWLLSSIDVVIRSATDRPSALISVFFLPKDTPTYILNLMEVNLFAVGLILIAMSHVLTWMYAPKMNRR